MNLRWLVGNYADPEFQLTRARQREVTRLAHHKHLAGVTLWTWTIAMTIAGWLAVGLAVRPLSTLLLNNGLPPVAAFLTSILTLCAAVCLMAAWLYRLIYAKPVRRAMRDLGYDVCIGCGYRLRGLNDDIARCPECGHPREPLPKYESPAEPDL